MTNNALFFSGRLFIKIFGFFGGIFLPSSLAQADPFEIIPQRLYRVFQSGNGITWTHIIEFLLHIMQLLITLSGVFAVILIMIGGFQMVLGATMDDKESGKKTIQHTLMGFVVIITAWIIVDITIALLTTDI